MGVSAALEYLAAIDPKLAAAYIFMLAVVPSVGVAIRFAWLQYRAQSSASQTRANQQQELIEKQRTSLTTELYKELDRMRAQVAELEVKLEELGQSHDAMEDTARAWRERAIHLRDCYDQAGKVILAMLKQDGKPPIEWPEEPIPAFHDIMQDNALRLAQGRAVR